MRGYCAAVRAALTDDGLPPLAASGLKLHDRLSQIAASLDRVAARAGSLPGGLKRLQQLLRRGLEETAALFPPVREAFKWVKRVARILKNEEQLPAAKVRRRLVQLLVRMRQAAVWRQLDFPADDHYFSRTHQPVVIRSRLESGRPFLACSAR